MAALVLLLVGLSSLTPATASAHAYLISSDPAHGASLPSTPDAVTVVFSEPITLPHGSSTTVRIDGRDVGGAAISDGARLRIPITAKGTGRYIVTWRIISSDTHSITGSIQFGVGVPASALDIAAAPEPPYETNGGEVLGRLASYAGLIAVTLVLLGPRRQRRTIAAAGAAALAVGAAIRLAVDLHARGTLSAESPVVVGASLALAAAGLALISARADRWRFVGSAAAVLLGALAITLAGHSAAEGPITVALATVHAGSAAVWLACICALFVHARTPRLTWAALAAISLVMLTGVAQSLLRVHWVGALTDTTYGRLVLVKIGLTAIALGVGILAQRRRTHRSASRRVLVEAVAVAAAFGIAGLLASTPTPVSAYRPTASTQADGQSYGFAVTVSPARSGQQSWKVRVRPHAGVEDPVRRLTAQLDDGTTIEFPVRVTAVSAPGSLAPADFSGLTTVPAGVSVVRGRLIAEIDDFTSEVARFEVPITIE